MIPPSQSYDLVQFRGSDWIDPGQIAGVIAVRHREPKRFGQSVFGATVLISSYSGWDISLGCIDWDEAIRCRDLLLSRADEAISSPQREKP
jgi:hypothetical protein